MKAKTTITITTRSCGVHFGTVGVVRRGRSRRVIHITDPRPYGFRHAAAHDALDWAYERGYENVEMPRYYGED
jgi:hypothetical protein